MARKLRIFDAFCCCLQPEKMHCVSFQESNVENVEKVSLNSCLPIPERRKNMVVQTARPSNLKCLKDILSESEPDSPVSFHSDSSSSVEELFPQVLQCVMNPNILKKTKSSHLHFV